MPQGPLGRRNRKLVSDINVVPYIDVMLVLLIIFMATAPLVIQGINVDLPQVDADAVPQEDDPPLIVTVDAEGRLYADLFFSSGESEPMQTTGELVATVLDLKRTRADLRVLIKGDQTVAYGRVVGVMSALKTAGIGEVGLITQPVEGEMQDLPAAP